MFLLILVLLVAMPLAELWAIISVAEVIGGWQTIALLLIDSLIGAWLLKAQGRGVLAKLDERLRAGELPTDELVDGLLILVAGALMLTPGFITDLIGFLLLLPPTRAPVRSALKQRFTSRVGRGFQFMSTGSSAGLGGFGFGGGFGAGGPGRPGPGRPSTPSTGRIWDAEVVEPDPELPDPGSSPRGEDRPGG
ncbi:MAG: FxsA family protein [Microthrixaceae bacterium]|nr:FxsA family protein [Microthrixaceae bacterium]